MRESVTIWRSLPWMLCALLVTVVSVDLLIATQPAMVADLSAALRGALTLQGSLMPPTDVLAAALSVATVVLTGAVLLAFARAVQQAPSLSFGPNWVAMCMLGVLRVEVPAPLEGPVFIALSALLLVAGGVALRSRSKVGVAVGWFAVLLPLAVLGASCADAGSFEGDAIWLAGALAVCALGVVLIARLGRKDREEIPGLEGVDVVEALFAQVERAEQSEARVRELERMLQTRPARVRTMTR